MSTSASTTGSARKRERENPCAVCGHYHKYEEGEVCGICGHRIPVGTDQNSIQISAFPSEILPGFLYLGGYDNASRSELLKNQGIYRLLNTVPSCQNLYKNSFTYHCLQDDKSLQFDEAIEFLEKCEREKARVLVYCMSGKSRSPAIVIAFLMKSKGWSLPRSHQWVKDRRSSVELSQAIYQQLEEYGQKLGSNESSTAVPPSFTTPTEQSFSFGFSKSEATPVAAFNTSVAAASIFGRGPLIVPPDGFTFGAGQAAGKSACEGTSVVSQANPNGSDIPMDGA